MKTLLVMVSDGKANMVMLASEGPGTSGFKRSFVDEVSRDVNCPAHHQ